MTARLFFIFTLFSIPSFGQQWMNWSEGAIVYSPIKKIDITIGGQYRWDVTNQAYGKTLLSAKVNAKITRFISIQGRYRRTWLPNEYFYLDQQIQTYGHRLSAGIQWDIAKTLKKTSEKRKWNVQYTSTYQWETFKFRRPQVYWRNQVEVSHALPLKKCKLQYSIESFYRTNQYYSFINDQVVYSGLLNEMRYSIGLKYAISKQHEIILGIIKRDFQTSKWDVNVLELGYQFSISSKAKG